MATPTSWDFTVCDGSGNALVTLTRHQGTSLTFTRNGVPECQFSLSHDDAECGTVLTALAQGTGGGVPTLKGYRLERDGVKRLRFNGYLATISEESGTDASTATFTFRGPFGRALGDGANRGKVYPNALTYTGMDAGLIAKDLIDKTVGAGPWMSTSTTNVELTVSRDRTYALGQNVGEAIVNLTNVLDGFDFEVTPTDVTTQFFAGSGTMAILGAFHVYARQGQDRPAAKFEYGPTTLANCSAMHRQTLPPVNLVRSFGGGGAFSYVFDSDSSLKYGNWEQDEVHTDISVSTTLDDIGNGLKRPGPVKTIDFTPDPRLAPSPWDDYWIGDTVRFYANRGALVEGPLSVRVNQITVVIDPDTGLESSEIPDPLTDDEARTIRAGLQTEVV